MNLRALAESDNAFMLEDSVSGFGVEIKLTRPGSSPSVAAVLAASIMGTTGTIVPAGTRWKAGALFYRQNAQVTIADGVGAIALTAEVAGAAGNLVNGTALGIVAAIAGLFSAAVITGTTTPGSDVPADTVYTVTGQYHRVGVDVDPETGLLIAGQKSAVTVRLSRFPVAALPDNDWTIETTDILGAAVKGKATNVLLDRTAGRATILFKR